MHLRKPPNTVKRGFIGTRDRIASGQTPRARPVCSKEGYADHFVCKGGSFLGNPSAIRTSIVSSPSKPEGYADHRVCKCGEFFAAPPPFFKASMLAKKNCHVAAREGCVGSLIILFGEYWGARPRQTPRFFQAIHARKKKHHVITMFAIKQGGAYPDDFVCA